jgi:hypothetical protein
MYARGKNFFLAMFFFPLFLVRRAGPFIWGGRFDAVLAMLCGVAGFWRARRAMPKEDWPREIGEETQAP